MKLTKNAKKVGRILILLFALYMLFAHTILFLFLLVGCIFFLPKVIEFFKELKEDFIDFNNHS